MADTLFTSGEIAEAVGAAWSNPPSDDYPVCGISTDSRANTEGALFIALTGERFDGHDFLEQAVASGARALCVGRDRLDCVRAEWKIPVLPVADTLLAYQALARRHKQRFPDLRTVAVTGSMGKTSVKEIIRSILAAAAGENGVCATRENTNNQVGVPQNLFRLDSRHRYCVIEMGSNHFGEIEPLSRCAEPDIAVITSIGPCHLEFFGDLEGVAREKSAIFAGLAPDGTAIIPRTCPAADILGKAAAGFKLSRFGASQDADFQVVYHGSTIRGGRIELRTEDMPDGIQVDWPLGGAHQALNAAAGFAVARSLGLSPETIKRGLEACVLPGMRMKISTVNGVTWINDAYNASPESVVAALEWLAEVRDRRPLIIVLGDMLELDAAQAVSRHQQILLLVRKRFADATCLLVGSLYRAASGSLPDASGFIVVGNAEEAKDRLEKLVAPGVMVFLKGSRGIRLEKITVSS